MVVQKELSITLLLYTKHQDGIKVVNISPPHLLLTFFSVIPGMSMVFLVCLARSDGEEILSMEVPFENYELS